MGNEARTAVVRVVTPEDVEELYGIMYWHACSAMTRPHASSQVLVDAQGAQIDENWWRMRLAPWTLAVVAAYMHTPYPLLRDPPGAETW